MVLPWSVVTMLTFAAIAIYGFVISTEDSGCSATRGAKAEMPLAKRGR